VNCRISDDGFIAPTCGSSGSDSKLGLTFVSDDGQLPGVQNATRDGVRTSLQSQYSWSLGASSERHPTRCFRGIELRVRVRADLCGGDAGQ